MKRASAGFRADAFKVEPRRVEDQIALHGAEPGGEIRDASGSVFDVHTPGDARPIQRSFKGCVDLRRTTRIQIRDVAAQKAKIQSAIQTQRQSATSRELHGARNLKIGVLASKSDRFDFERVARGTEVNNARVLQLDVCV